MPAEVHTLIEQFRQQLDLRDAAQAARMAAAWASAQRGLVDEYERVAQEMADRAARGLPVARWHVQRAERYQSLMRQVAAMQRELVPTMAAQIADEQAACVRLALQDSQMALDYMAPGIVGQFDRLNVSAVQNMVGNTSAGGPLDRLLRQSWAGSEAAIGDALMRGIALGWSPLKTAAAMRQAANIPLQRSLVIARTETLRAYRTATEMQYKKAGIEGYRRLADKSRRTCVACLMMDGQWFPMSTPFAEHPMGRCAMVPARDKNAPIPWKTGADWFAEQDAATQREMMGPGRYDAWKQGDFKLTDMPVLVRNPTWGDSWHVRSLRDLTGGGAGAVTHSVPYQAFGTVADAERYARDVLKMDVDYSRFTTEQANAINEGFARVRAIYDGPATSKFAVVRPFDEDLTARWAGTHMAVNPEKFNLQFMEMDASSALSYQRLPQRIANLRQQLDEAGGLYAPADVAKLQSQIARLEAQIAAGPPPPFLAAKRLSDVVVHEYGHAIENDLMMGQVKSVPDFLPPSVLSQRGIRFEDTFQARAGMIAKTEGSRVSEYATKNSEEYFAESWVRFVNNESDVIHPDLVKIFERITR